MPAIDTLMQRLFRWVVLMICWLIGSIASGQFTDPGADSETLPAVPPGFSVSLYAREPLVRQPCSMAFDHRGRLFVGMGPQYRNPTPETPGDQVVMVLDQDGDQVAETTKVFAEGFNAIQGLAWVGDALWIANAPDLTVVRDRDGDDIADEYLRLYTDLGNLEHGLHGLNVGPDGKVYMSKGNSKGFSEGTRLAPKPFRDLWGIDPIPGAPEFPDPVLFQAANYQRQYHDPADDWGLDGGILRCKPDGSELEIVCRGFRNPWDISFDSGFHWLGTDNDQVAGDRVFMSIPGGHFGWNHPWSSHWSEALHLPTAPVSGPLWEGSGTGVIYYEGGSFPESHQNAFFINDWLGKVTYIWRPVWDGALMRAEGGTWEPFVVGGSSLYRPTDVEVGPDGSLWILGWSRGYGVEWKDGQMTNEGRIFRVAYDGQKSAAAGNNNRQDWGNYFGQTLDAFSLDQCIDALRSPLASQKTRAQEELVRRGNRVIEPLLERLRAGGLSTGQETWTVWAVGRIDPSDESLDRPFIEFLRDETDASLNLRIQSIRILADRVTTRRQGLPQTEEELPQIVLQQLGNREARIRYEAVQAIRQTRGSRSLEALMQAIDAEEDPTTFYAAWKTLGTLASRDQRMLWLKDSSAKVRLAALLSLLEDGSLAKSAVRAFVDDADQQVREVAASWLEKIGDAAPVVRGKPLNRPSANDAASNPAPAVPPDNSIVSFTAAAMESRRPYRIVPEGARAGGVVYSDRSYVFSTIPEEFQDADLLQTSNDDDGSRGDQWLRLEVAMESRLVVAMDSRQRQVPRWLTSRFKKLPSQIQADHWSFDLYETVTPPGTVVLGGNTEDGVAGGKGNYVVLVQPVPLVERDAPVQFDDVVALLDEGNAERGKVLFAHRDGVGCYRCHMSDKPESRLAPSLENIASRTTVEHLVRSILEPNVVITEGFNLQIVATESGQVFSGVLVEESGVALTLGQTNGELVTIRKDTIELRRTEKRSAMPNVASLLTASQVADLVAYLCAGSVGDRENGSKSRELGIFRVTEFPDRLRLESNQIPVGDFVFRDASIRRPYFANLYSPSGIQVTRNHPPDPNTDAADHANMHPGLWYGFGDISGADFWRNRASIEHRKFVEAPRLEGHQLRFATSSDLVREGGEVLGSVVCRIAVAPSPDAWMIVWEMEFQSDASSLVFGDQEEMGFGARVATGITEKAGGRLTSSNGLASAAATWGQAADWCDYSGTQGGKSLGITLMGSPKNFQTSWWHNRDYGVFVANPFGRASMKQGDPKKTEIAKGQKLVLSYAAVIHEGLDYSPQKAMQRYLEILELFSRAEN